MPLIFANCYASNLEANVAKIVCHFNVLTQDVEVINGYNMDRTYKLNLMRDLSKNCGAKVYFRNEKNDIRGFVFAMIKEKDDIEVSFYCYRRL